MSASLRNQVIQADLTWTGDKFEQNVVIEVDQNGRIVDVGQNISKQVTCRLNGHALLPGMINAHSHAFHREMRRRTEEKNANGPVSNFWSWRDQMYNIVETSDKESFRIMYRETFNEMLRCGITSVGEFHYWHHSKPRMDNNNNMNDTYDMDKIVLEAAKEAGIRIVLLQTFYEQAGVKPEQNGYGALANAQKHFIAHGVAEFWTQFDELSKVLCDETQTMGVAAHSIRAVNIHNIKKLVSESIIRKIPFHIHLEEQPKEIEDSLDVYKCQPAQLFLNSLGNPSEDCCITAVHCTFTEPSNLDELQKRNVSVCVCPLTEGRLGDGIIKWPSNFPQKYHNFCIGTDCNFRICMAEEMRWMLYTQQMEHNKRGFHNIPPTKTSQILFNYATEGGAKSLGLTKCGGFKKGFWFDAATINLNHSILRDCSSKTLLETFIFASSESVISSAIVAGNWHIFDHNLDSTYSLSPSNHIKMSPIIKGDSVVTLTESMMAIDSTTGSEKLMSQHLANHLMERGWKVELQPLHDNPNRLNVLAHRQDSAGPRHASWKQPTVVMNSHIDTVPPYIAPRFDEVNQVLYGRGSCDAKGQVAAMIFSAETFLADHPDKKDEIVLLFVVGEEVDHVGASESQKLQLNPKFIICGEPTELKQAVGQKGVCKIDLVATGKAAHSGYPELGDSAVDKLLEALQIIKSIEWPKHDSFGDTTMNIGVIGGGVACNIIAASANASIAFRLVTNPEEIMSKITSALKGHDVEIKVGTRNPPLELHTFDILPKQMVSFNTDLPFLGFDLQTCKAVLFGPGSIHYAHGSNEHITVQDLNTGVDNYYTLLKQMIN